jgi:hypothetical protein
MGYRLCRRLRGTRMAHARPLVRFSRRLLKGRSAPAIGAQLSKNVVRFSSGKPAAATMTVQLGVA